MALNAGDRRPGGGSVRRVGEQRDAFAGRPAIRYGVYKPMVA